MKNVMYFISLVLLTSSCQDTKRNQIEMGILPEMSSIVNNDADKNLIDQLKQYNNALHGENSDPERVLNFIYSDVFIYLKNENPNTYSREMVISLYNEPVKRLQKMARENNIKYNTRTGNIVRRASEGNKLIYSIEIFMDMEYGMDKHTTGDKILGVSLDNGKIWKFLEINSTSTPIILNMKFSQATLDKIL